MTENKFPVEMILLDQVFANPWQIRKTMEATYIHELANKIAQMGLQEFPHARPMVDRPSCYELVFGHNRLAAYRLLLQRRSVSQAAAPGFLPALAQAKPKTEDVCPRCGQVPRVYRRLDDGWRCGQCNSRVGLITATV